MPHIHNQPGQRDITVSAYIVRRDGSEWKCMVHFHKKMQKLLQIGEHIELNETPWQAIAHELTEESGYTLDDVQVLQYTGAQVEGGSNVVHPVPFAMNTHNVGNEHYRSDLCYGFLVDSLPTQHVSEDESDDIRWLTKAELQEGVVAGEVLEDVALLYDFLLKHVGILTPVSAALFSLKKPSVAAVTYKTGLPGVSGT